MGFYEDNIVHKYIFNIYNYYYYYKKSANCPSCANQCAECVTKATNCTKCKTIEDRLDIPTCECKDGLYDNGINDECKICHFHCKLCESEFLCTKCAGNRIGPDNGNCVCPQNSTDMSHLNTSFCSTC